MATSKRKSTVKPRSMSRRFFSTLLIVVNITICVLTFCSAYSGLINPASWVFPALLAMAFIPLLALMVALGVILGLCRKRMALINLAVVILCIGPIRAYFPVHFARTAAESESTFTFMTFNAIHFFDMTNYNHHGYDFSPSLEYVINSEADVIALQECLDLREFKQWHINEEQYERLTKVYPYRYHSHDMGLISKYPAKVINIEYTDTFSTFSLGRFDVEIEGRTLHVFVTHLQSIGLTDEDKQSFVRLSDGTIKGRDMKRARHSILTKLSDSFRKRAEQAGIVRQFVENLPGNVIVCGDFNDVPGCYAERVIAGDRFKSAYTEAGLGYAITFHADRFWFRIDHILYSGNMMPLKTWVATECNTGDHYPMCTTMKWTPVKE